MTRNECEEALLRLAEEAWKIYKEFREDGVCLSISVSSSPSGGPHISINETLLDENQNPLDGEFTDIHPIYLTKFSDGHVWNTEKWHHAMQKRVQEAL